MQTKITIYYKFNRIYTHDNECLPNLGIKSMCTYFNIVSILFLSRQAVAASLA